jgi:hypothetical protein
MRKKVRRSPLQPPLPMAPAAPPAIPPERATELIAALVEILLGSVATPPTVEVRDEREDHR